ncbi:MAG: TetR/AcrR family transcriptional regulator [Myxococcales bacterium]|nr:TetR/AcrR family transcriptional regulator [Myxococcales bacterium]
MGRRTRGVGQHHGNLRAALLDAALQIVAEGDVAALTLRAVARRAGVSPGAPYHHFADKQALLVAVANDGFRQLGAALDFEPTDPVCTFERRCAAYVRFALDHGAHYRVMFSPDLDGEGIGQVAAAALTAFAGLVEAARAVTPELDDTELHHRAVLAWSTAHGAVTLQLGGMVQQLAPALDAQALATAVGAACVAIVRTR